MSQLTTEADLAGLLSLARLAAPSGCCGWSAAETLQVGEDVFGSTGDVGRLAVRLRVGYVVMRCVPVQIV